MSSRISPRTWLALALLLAAAPAGAQERKDEAPPSERVPIERVFVPREAFTKVLARHPGGVLLTEAELQKLVAEASKRPAPAPLRPEAKAPLEAAIQRLAITGQVEGDTAVVTCVAEVAVLRDGVVALPLPLQSLGLEGVWVGEEPAQVLLTDRGPCVLVTGAAAQGEAVVAARSVRWRFAQRVQPLDEPGAGLVAFPLPAAASASVSLVVPGELELVPRAGQPTLWTKVQGGTTTLQGADGGGRAGSHLLELAWRPRHAVARLAPYVTCSDRSLLTVKRGVVVLDARLHLEVHRAERQSFALELPPGFVVRQLECQQSKLSYLQRADHLEVSLPAPRTGTLDLVLAAELPTPAGSKDGLALELRPLRFLDLQRVDGLFAVAAGPDTLLHFQSVHGLERADLAAYGGDTPGLLRVYRREAGAQPKLVALAKPQEARVGLTLQAALQLEQRQVKALALYRFSVEAGSVFSFRARLPQGYALERALVRDEHGRAIPHRVSERALAAAGADPNDPSQRTVELTLELSQGLRPGQELLLTVEATREAPDGLAGRGLLIPRFEGEPHSELRGYLGFAPDPAFRLAGAELAGLTPIPADELPRVGLDVPGLVLGYRVEAEGYRGRVEVREKETRVSVTELAHHRVHERVLTSELRLDLDVSGAPLDKLVLLVPKGTGPLVTVRGEGVLRETEVLGAAKDGRDRLQVSFARRFSGERSLQVSFQTKLPAPATNGGDESFTASLPQVAVEDATRAHGTLAVFSTGAADVSAEPTGLRAIEVTEVPALQAGGEVEGRPLFAYTYVRDHALELSVKRHGAAPVLTAVAEELALQTSAGPDGSARHVARFKVKNLSNQFFALKLPEGATLWSVAVDGQGVKPAAQGGVQLVPIPTAGTKGPNEVTEVVATYTQQASPWGFTASAGLEAPALAFGEGGDAVPVLRTTWSLSLPEDYRVLSVAGNLDGQTLNGVRPLLVSSWGELRRGPYPWLGGLALLGLLVAASARARAATLRVAGGSVAVLAGVRDRAASAASEHRRGLGLLALFVLTLAVLLTMIRGRALPGAARFEQQKALRTDTATRGIPMIPVGDDDDHGGANRAASGEEKPQELSPDAGRNPFQGAARFGARPEGAAAPSSAPVPMPSPMPERQRGRAHDRREAGAAGNKRDLGGVQPAQPGEADGAMGQIDPPSLQLTPPPAPPEKPKPARGSFSYDDDVADGDAEPAEDAKAQPRKKSKSGAKGYGGGEAPGSTETEKPLVVLEGEVETTKDMPKGTDLSNLKNKELDLAAGKAEALKELRKAAEKAPDGYRQVDANEVEVEGLMSKTKLPQAARIDQTAAGWQVGLRSLVLDLGAVGDTRRFERPGGDSRLSVRVVREAGLVALGGALALLSFLAALLLPRSGKVSAVALLLVALTAATVGAALLPHAAVTPLFNAAALGLLAAAPVLALVALGRAWERGPFARLKAAYAAQRGGSAPAGEHGPAGGRAATTAAALLLLFLAAPGNAQAQDSSEPGKVFVPYDSKDPAAARGEKRAATGKVFVPREVYEELMRRAFPERHPTVKAAPLAPALITRVDYRGRLDQDGLTLTAEVAVDVLAEGWQRVPLGLVGTGLKGSEVKGSFPEAKVKVAPAGGYELLARGPGRYTVQLDLVVPGGGDAYAFSTVPCLAAQMAIQTPVRDRRLVVSGARAQREQEVSGEATVLASLGDASRVSLSLRSREELAAGASEASAETASLVWVRRGRLDVLSVTTFTISGAGREGFVFALPQGFEVTEVEVAGARSWHVADGRLHVALRRPAVGQRTVTIRGEQQLDPKQQKLTAPQLEAQGVSRESGTIGLATAEGLKVRPARTERLRQVETSSLHNLASTLGVSAGWAFGFARRPCSLELEQVDEAVEVHAETRLRASVRPDRYALDAEVRYDVRSGKVYRLRVLAPAGFSLLERTGLDVREVDEASQDGGTVYTFGLGSGLSGPGVLHLRLVRRLTLEQKGELPFPDLRPLDVSRESTQVAVSTTESLEVRGDGEAGGLALRDVARLTRGWQAAEAGGAWQLGFERQNGRVAGLAASKLAVTRPSPFVTGSWVLHARVERDVVRYTLRALYEIEHAGVDRFQVQVPAAAAGQLRVDAQNQREVKTAAAGEGKVALTVELQSPAEVFYDLAVSWEQVLPEGASFELPAVNVLGVDRAVRGFVLVEKAPEVADLLEEAARTGVLQPARAANAPALPPGKGAEDFQLVYQVPLRGDEAWAATCRLKAREVTLPPPAQVLWAHLQSVFTRQGEVRHRVRYRVRNLRLQFLSLELPENAEVWSVFVAGQPRRLHRQDRMALIPLPKRSAADLPFDVEVTYATPSAGSFGEGALEVFGPRLRTERVDVQKTFWTAYLPEGFGYRGFDGTVTATNEAEAAVAALQREVEVLAGIDELARSGSGNAQKVADLNEAEQRQRISQQLLVCKQAEGLNQGKTQEGEKLANLLGKYDQTFRQLEQQIDQRRQREEARAQQQRKQQDQQVMQVEGNNFTQGQSGWNYSQNAFKRGQRVRWSNVGDEQAQNEDSQQQEAQGVYGQQAQQGQQGQQGQQQRMQQQKQIVLRVGKGQALNLDNAQLLEQTGGQNVQNLDGRAYKGDEAEEAPKDAPEEAGRNTAGASEGLLSIRIGFATPGKAFHFVSKGGDEAPRLRFKSSPEGSGKRALRAGQGVTLLLLLAALLRLGLHLPKPGRGAAQTLALLLGVGLAAATLAHPGGLALTVIASLLALRHGPLWPAGAGEAAASGVAA